VSEGIELTKGWKEVAAAGSDRGETVVFVSRAGKVCGMIRLGDTLRVDMPQAMADLKARGLEVHLVSGDTEAATGHVAGLLGVDRFRGGVLPADKVEWVRGLQREGHRVGMAGDGANDAAALAVADVGFATGDALTVTKNASDMTILSFSGHRLLSALDLSRLTSRTVVTNLFLALVYNLIALPVALAGLVNPVIAVIAMLLSSLTVVGNSARIAGHARDETE
jgi:P-type E1-E2 ATPase